MEIFKDVPGYEGLYQVSNIGRVKSLERYKSDGRYLKERILKSNKARSCMVVCLYNNGIAKSIGVHKLVAKVFVMGYRKGLQVNHKDDNIRNNTVDNLYWGTQHENMQDMYRNGYKSHRSKEVNQLNKKREFIMKHESIRSASIHVGADENAIQNCLKGRSSTSKGFRWEYAMKGGVCLSD